MKWGLCLVLLIAFTGLVCEAKYHFFVLQFEGKEKCSATEGFPMTLHDHHGGKTDVRLKAPGQVITMHMSPKVGVRMHVDKLAGVKADWCGQRIYSAEDPKRGLMYFSESGNMTFGTHRHHHTIFFKSNFGQTKTYTRLTMNM